jgi:cell division protein FtsB
MKKRLINWLILIIGLSLIISLSRDILRLLRSGERIKLAEEKVYQLEKEQQELLEKKQYYRSVEFIEEEARNKLGLARPGETIVILPPNIPKILGQQEEKPTEELPNWQKWWRLFF